MNSPLVVEQAKELLAKTTDLARDAVTELLKGVAEDVKEAFYKMRFESYFVPENERKTIEEYSPSKKYKLVMTVYNTKPGCWEYTRGRVYRVADNELIADVKRNYSAFPFSWIEPHKNGHDYLVCGADYQGQTVVELDTGKRVDNLPSAAKKGFGFCWAHHHPNADGTLLAVGGCYWACPYETVVYMFDDPMNPPYVELVRGDSDFDGWTGINSCKMGFSKEVVCIPEGAPEEYKALAALNGKDLDEITTEQADALDKYESDTGKYAWKYHVENAKEWVRPPMFDVAKKATKDYIGWWKERGDVVPEDVDDVSLMLERLLSGLTEEERQQLMSDTESGPLVEWWLAWKKEA